MPRQFRRAVVTGGAGFLGARVCQRLLERDTAVLCLDNFLTGSRAIAAPPDGPSFKSRFCDVTEPFDVAGPIDLVLHLASPAAPADRERYPLRTLESAGLGTRNALQLAARKGARFVLASTSAVYGDSQVSRQREDYHGNVNPVGPRSVYDEAKRYAEALTAAYERTGLADTAIARIFDSYGPGMRPDDGRLRAARRLAGGAIGDDRLVPWRRRGTPRRAARRQAGRAGRRSGRGGALAGMARGGAGGQRGRAGRCRRIAGSQPGSGQ